MTRNPYVGAGADGARRSAQVDREELDTLPADHPRREALEESAAAWDRQADELERAELERTTALNPITGVVVELEEAELEDLVAEVEELDRRLDAARAFREDLAVELAKRADRRNERTVKVGDAVLKVNAPTSESYDVDATRTVLRRLVDRKVLDESVLNSVIVYPPRPPAPPARVALGELNKLKRNPAVAAELAEARSITKTKRTAKVERKDG